MTQEPKEPLEWSLRTVVKSSTNHMNEQCTWNDMQFPCDVSKNHVHIQYVMLYIFSCLMDFTQCMCFYFHTSFIFTLFWKHSSLLSHDSDSLVICFPHMIHLCSRLIFLYTLYLCSSVIFSNDTSDYLHKRFTHTSELSTWCDINTIQVFFTWFFTQTIHLYSSEIFPT